jgi:hypothetical protein
MSAGDGMVPDQDVRWIGSAEPVDIQVLAAPAEREGMAVQVMQVQAARAEWQETAGLPNEDAACWHPIAVPLEDTANQDIDIPSGAGQSMAGAFAGPS